MKLSDLLTFLTEHKTVFLWTVTGGILGLVVAIVGIVLFYRFMVSRQWPSKEPWGALARRVTIALSVITHLPSFTLFGSILGFGYGTI